MTRAELVRSLLRLAEDADHHEERARQAYAMARMARRRAAELRVRELEAVEQLRAMEARRG